MKILLSINGKFKEYEPCKLINEIIKSKHVKGIELFLDLNISEEYIKDIINLCVKHDLIFQIHAPFIDSINKLDELTKKLERYQIVYNNVLKVTIHPIENYDETIKIVEKLNNQNNKNIVYALENLNDIPDTKRMKKEEIKRILKIYPNIRFTYDIGHELIENIIPEIDDFMLDRLVNIHMHYFRDCDHYPIEKEEFEHFKYIISKIKKIYIEEIYVAEYSIDFIEGNNIEDRIISYIKKCDELGDVISEYQIDEKFRRVIEESKEIKELLK